MDSYTVTIDNFEGPMDLLLYFINRDKIDINDIPISDITNEYLEYIQIMKTLNIDVGADFIFMASLLIQIKARTLLPKSDSDNSLDVEDPRTELAARLVEYKRFKEISYKLNEVYNSESLKFEQQISSMSDNRSIDSDIVYNTDTTLYDLLKIFKELIDNHPDNNRYEINRENINIDDQIELIHSSLRNNNNTIWFSSLANKGKTKLYIIGLCLALLDMIKSSSIIIKQEDNFSDFLIIQSS